MKNRAEAIVPRASIHHWGIILGIALIGLPGTRPAAAGISPTSPSGLSSYSSTKGDVSPLSRPAPPPERHAQPQNPRLDPRVAAQDSKQATQMPPDVKVFLDRVFRNIPAASNPPQTFLFKSWEVDGKITNEGIGLMPVSAIDPEKLIARVMDVDHYVGNIDYVKECRGIPDPRFSPPHAVRFYQYLDLPMISNVHHELVLVDGGTRKGYRYAYWYMLEPETKRLDPNKGARSAFNIGAWIVSPKAVGYALSSWPMREDVGYLSWKAMTSGADLAAKSTIENNIKGMISWTKKK